MTDIPAGPPVSPTPPLPPAPPLPPEPYQGPGGAPTIEVGFAGPAAQRRLTVLFRVILAIPQFIVLYVLTIAAEVVLVIGWFGALFTGALPRFAADFLAGMLRWQARVNAYLLLLTDQYPPFSLEDSDYAVRVATQPGKLNRLAVLFRIFLLIPAGLLVGVLTYGLETIALFVIWLIVLITGRMPDSAHAAISAVLRYTLRYIGYFYLLTSEYPAGLFGDQPAFDGRTAGTPYPGTEYPTAPGSATTPGYQSAAGFPPAPAQPPAGDDQQVTEAEGYQQAGGTGPAPSWGQPAPDSWGQATPPDATPPYGTPPPPYGTPPPPYGTPPPPYGTPPPPYGTPPPGYGAQPSSGYGTQPAVPVAGWSVPGSPPWRLVLSQAARRLVTFFIIFGAVIIVGYVLVIALVVANNNTVSRAEAQVQANAAFSKLNSSMNAFGSQTTVCRTSSHPLQCVTAADQRAGQAFGDYAQAQGAIGMPAGSPQAANSLLVSDAGRAQHSFQQLAASTSIANYEQAVSAANLQQVLNQLEQHYQHLQTTLENG